MFFFCRRFVLLLASCEQGLQHALDPFSAVCDKAGIKICTENHAVLGLYRNLCQFVLQAKGSQSNAAEFTLG